MNAPSTLPPRAALNCRLGDIVRGGTSIVLVSVALGNLLRIVSNVTLARLLDAEAFGVTGIIASITFVLTMVADIGTIPFVIRHANGDDPVFLDEVWTIRLGRGVLLTAVMVLLSAPLARYAGKPLLQPVIATWGAIFLIEGLSSMSFATALRERKVGRLSVLDLSTAAFQVVVAIVLALILRSYWALVGAVLLAQLFEAALSYLLFPGSARRLRFSRARNAELWRFSRFIVSSSVLGIFISQTDKIFFARILSLRMFGLYSIATTLALAPMAITSAYSERILYPAYAAAFRTAPETLRKVYYDAKRTISLLYMFAVGGLVGSAPLVVAILYQPRYASVAPLLRLLALAPLLSFNNNAADRVLIANGQSWSTLSGNIVRLAWLGAGCTLAYLTERQMILVATVGLIEAPALVFNWLLLWRYGLLDMKEELAALGVAASGAAVGAGGATLILSLFS